MAENREYVAPGVGIINETNTPDNKEYIGSGAGITNETSEAAGGGGGFNVASARQNVIIGAGAL